MLVKEHKLLGIRVSSGKLMYSMVTRVKSIVLYTWKVRGDEGVNLIVVILHIYVYQIMLYTYIYYMSIISR